MRISPQRNGNTHQAGMNQSEGGTDGGCEENADLVSIALESRQQELSKGLWVLDKLVGSSGEQLHLS